MTLFLKEVDLESTLAKLSEDCGFIQAQYNDPDKPLYRPFDNVNLLDRNAVLEFIHATQPKAWDALEIRTNHTADEKIINYLVKEINLKGLVTVLKTGFDVLGSRFRIIYFKPADQSDIDAYNLYTKNICICARQFHYSSNAAKKSIDVVLLVNGIPLVAIELKNQFTGQSTSNALTQFCVDRDQTEPMFRLNRRCLMMFAMDNYTADMATKLEGRDTRFFPYNQGSNGPGKAGLGGNIVESDRVPTQYIFDSVLSKDSLLSLISDFITFDDSGDKPKMIVPRYHQLHCVNYLSDLIREQGMAHSYLVEHSAGSGKSNTIAWLAYRLLSLHKNGESMFNSVIICVHRRNLNQQLNNTVSLFEYQPGMVAYVRTSAELRQALLEGNKIIITTIQKFGMFTSSFKLFNRNFAVLFDEAHTSTTGALNKKTKMALGKRELTPEEEQVLEASYQSEEEINRAYEKIKYDGHQNNMVFVAFTATPGKATLVNFGRENEEGGFEPHHIYSMCQAIDEGYICDVLEDYNTYRDFYKVLMDTTKSDIPVNSSKAKSFLKKLVTSDPCVINQKADIIVEYMHEFVTSDLNGNAKAMLVVDSREQVLHYKAAILKLCKEKGYTDILPMAAFSSTLYSSLFTEEELSVLGITGDQIAEGMCNKMSSGSLIKESQTVDYFDKHFNLMIAADKFQVGFDQPKLTTMFVDKSLAGSDAVQTLSRLNRTILGVKKHTHVIDFRNEREDIMDAFNQFYYETDLDTGYDPNYVYDKLSSVQMFGVFNDDDISNFDRLLSTGGQDDIKRICFVLDRARRNALNLSDEDYVKFRKMCNSMVRTYSMVTVNTNLLDPRFSDIVSFVRLLLKVLPPRTDSELPDIASLVNFYQYRLVNTGAGSIGLDKGDPLPPPGPGSAGSSGQKEDLLSNVVREFNERWGLDSFNEDDRVRRLKSISEHFQENLENQDDYRDWTRDSFRKEFFSKARTEVIKELIGDREYFDKMMSDTDNLDKVVNAILDSVLDRIRKN